MNGDIQVIAYESELYPPLLREIAQPPAQLYVRGSVELLTHRHLVAVVGSRKASTYGNLALKHILPPALAAGVVAVSGLAYGIDALVARVSLAAATPTIAILGSGIDDSSIYPRSHMHLAQQLLRQGGTLVSEYPPGTPAMHYHFPARNRIIAGLCMATLIVQARELSGSLITARHALDANRDVGAVPGSITDPLSAGTNALIKQGATPVTEAADLLQLLGLEASPHTQPQNLSAAQQELLKLVTTTPRHIDELIAGSTLTPATATAQLVELELRDLIQNVGGMQYVRKS